MKLYLITLTISLIALYAFIKRSYKYASVQDEVEYDPDGIYRHYHIKRVLYHQSIMSLISIKRQKHGLVELVDIDIRDNTIRSYNHSNSNK